MLVSRVFRVLANPHDRYRVGRRRDVTWMISLVVASDGQGIRNCVAWPMKAWRLNAIY